MLPKIRSVRALSRAEHLDYCYQCGSFRGFCTAGESLPGNYNYLCATLQQHRLNMADSARRVQSLRTYTDAVHNAVTAEYAECIAHPFQTTVGLGITAIDQESIRRE